jgi:hypothetical protein
MFTSPQKNIPGRDIPAGKAGGFDAVFRAVKGHFARNDKMVVIFASLFAKHAIIRSKKNQ